MSCDECRKQVSAYPNNSFKGFPTKEMVEEEYFNSLEEKRSNYEVGKQTSGSSRVKTYIVIFQLIIIVFLVLFYVM
jgi:viroplasmin and RNaseH domain-containing protein